MINRLKSAFGNAEKKEEPIVELPEVRPFYDLDVESAPPAAHKPDHVKMNINHAGHMRVIARNDQEAARISLEALGLTKEKKTVNYGEDAISAYISEFPFLKFMTITKNGDTLCAFPFFNIGKPVDVRITDITECENGLEGQLEIYTSGSALTFFDTMYFKNKNRYFPGKDAKVLLSGIAYVLTKAKGIAVNDKRSSGHEMADSELAFRYENGDLDDYVFRGKVKEAREFMVMGKKAQIIEVPLRIGVDTVIDVYICATENAIKERLHKGDHVSGIVWLQGFVVC